MVNVLANNCLFNIQVHTRHISIDMILCFCQPVRGNIDRELFYSPFSCWLLACLILWLSSPASHSVSLPSVWCRAGRLKLETSACWSWKNGWQEKNFLCLKTNTMRLNWLKSTTEGQNLVTMCYPFHITHNYIQIEHVICNVATLKWLKTTIYIHYSKCLQ